MTTIAAILIWLGLVAIAFSIIDLAGAVRGLWRRDL